MEEKKKVTKKKNTTKSSNKKTTVASKKKVIVPKQETKEKEKKQEPVTNVEPVVIKNGKINNISLLVQAVLTTYTVLLLVGGLFDDLFLDIFDAVASILLFVIAYNNAKIFKRKNLTTIYVIAGILFAGMFIFHIFN